MPMRKYISFRSHSWHTRCMCEHSVNFRVAKIAFLVLAFSLFILLFLPQTPLALAQIPQLGNQLQLDVRPQAPRPGDTVSITAQSFSADVNRSNFTWSVNGKVIKRGLGENKIEFRTGEAGSVSVVRVIVETPTLGTLSSELTLRPARVNLIWEADSYTPPFYQGKALPSSNIKKLRHHSRHAGVHHGKREARPCSRFDIYVEKRVSSSRQSFRAGQEDPPLGGSFHIQRS